jgi:hypothetical protein
MRRVGIGWKCPGCRAYVPSRWQLKDIALVAVLRLASVRDMDGPDTYTGLVALYPEAPPKVLWRKMEQADDKRLTEGSLRWARLTPAGTAMLERLEAEELAGGR